MTTQASQDMIYVARETFEVRDDGYVYSIVAGLTRLRAGHPALSGNEHRFEARPVNYEYEEATDVPGERRG